MSFNIHSTIAQLFYADHLIPAEVTLIGAEANKIVDADFHYLQAGPAAIILARLALLGCLGWCLWLLRRTDDATRYGLVWPLMITLTAVTSPLSWVYYFIPAVAFLPVLYDRFGFREGRLLICLIVVPLTGPVVGAYVNLEIVPNMHQLAGTLAMTGLTAAFTVALGRSSARTLNAGGVGQCNDAVTDIGPYDGAGLPERPPVPAALAAE